MTRLAVLADIHGNLPALRAVIDDMAQYEVDQVVVTGDSINWGPYSRGVMEVISERRWPVIRGNNELYLLDYDTERAPAHWARFTMPPYLRAQLGDQWASAIAALPDTLQLRFRDAPPIQVVHGIPGDPWTAITPQSSAAQIRRWLRDCSERALICAHSHIPLERHVGDWRIFNPGSVGVPLDGEHSASYMILDGRADGWTLAAHRRVPFDTAPLLAEFERTRFTERCGVTAHLVIDEFQTARLQLAAYLDWKREHYPGRGDSFDLLREFRELPDIEPYMPPAYRGLTSALYRD
ncbi:MAG: metallophosphoesterase family protein [Chloroflexi bacterium]|nr:metallophosphoesterase family protein [Chloroflexota bacterium]